LGLGSFFKSIQNTLGLAKRSDRQEYMLYLKLVALGLAIVGGIGFIVQFIAVLIRLS